MRVYRVAAAAALATFLLSPPPVQAQSRLKALIERLRGDAMPEGIVKTNGRIEATQIDVSAKYAGRLAEVLGQGGRRGHRRAGDRPHLVAGIRSAAARRAGTGAYGQAGARRGRGADRPAQKRSNPRQHRCRTRQGAGRKGLSDQADLRSARRPRPMPPTPRYGAAQAQRDQAQFAIQTAEAEVERIEAILVDLDARRARAAAASSTSSPASRRGRRCRHPHRHASSTSADVYMTIYLPAAQAGQLALGDEARIILDPVAAIRHPGDGQLRRGRRAVHAEKRRDRRGAREADLPRQASGRSARARANTTGR